MMLRISIEHVLKEFSSIVAFKEFQHKPVGVIFRVEDAVSASAQNGVEPLRGELHVLIQVGVGSKEKKETHEGQPFNVLFPLDVCIYGKLSAAAVDASSELKDFAAVAFKSLRAGWEEAKKTFDEGKK